MTTSEKKRQFEARRIFLTEKDKSFQIFKFWQEKDGSIYCCWPNFDETIWLVPVLDNTGNLALKAIDSTGDGKLSIHKDGMCAFRAHNDSKNRPLIIKGNKLMDAENNECGARHLFTIFSKEPSFSPGSALFNRETDYPINTEKMEPYVAIFFAIPQTQKGLQVNFQTSFNIDDLDNIPPKGGWGIIELKHHDVFWYIYRTKHMEKWPKKNQVIYNDGFTVPFFIGTGECQFRLELRMPKYLLNDNNLSVQI